MLHFLILLSALALEESPKIISLDPSTTELIYDLDLKANLIGKDEASNKPKEAKSLPIVSRHLQLNKERILELKPDWIIAHDIGFEKLKANYQPWGIKILKLKNNHLQDYIKNVKNLSKHFEMKNNLNDIKEKISLKNVPNLNASYIAFIDSTLKIASGTGTFLEEALSKCGLKNLVQQSGYPRLSREFLYQNKADYIFFIEKGKGGRQGIGLNPDVFSRLSLRFFRGVRKLCKSLESKSVPKKDGEFFL